MRICDFFNIICEYVQLFEDFDLCHPNTSVSMTINETAPTLLAMFFNTAINQQTDKFREEMGREPGANEAAAIKASTISQVRGTVQADILKEDQTQTTCMVQFKYHLYILVYIYIYIHIYIYIYI